MRLDIDHVPRWYLTKQIDGAVLHDHHGSWNVAGWQVRILGTIVTVWR